MKARTPNLPTRLLRALQTLARTYQEQGLKLFIFGSFARGDQRPTSDLDLGVEWSGERDPRTFTRLYEAIQELPTIRKIELVDFSQVDSAFKNVVGSDKIYLTRLEGLPNGETIEKGIPQEEL